MTAKRKTSAASDHGKIWPRQRNTLLMKKLITCLLVLAPVAVRASPCIGTEVSIDAAWRAPQCHVSKPASPSDGAETADMPKLEVRLDRHLRSGQEVVAQIALTNPFDHELGFSIEEECLGLPPQAAFGVMLSDSGFAEASPVRALPRVGLLMTTEHYCPRPLVRVVLVANGRATLALPFRLAVDGSVSNTMRRGPLRRGRYRVTFTMRIVGGPPLHQTVDIDVR